ncbi:type II toxin-antitoxin system VapC family toxin [soil metagenome]
MDGGAPLIAVDTNILVYAHREEFPQHPAALGALDGFVAGQAAWALPLFVAGEFLRVVTHPRLDPPTDPRTAVAALESLFESPNLQVLFPGQRYWEILKGLMIDGRVRGNLVHDAQIAALCMEHGADIILTEDRDFRSFAGLTVRPLG